MLEGPLQTLQRRAAGAAAANPIAERLGEALVVAQHLLHLLEGTVGVAAPDAVGLQNRAPEV
jgi:hypothetical protein